jgi:hypothetical protein
MSIYIDSRRTVLIVVRTVAECRRLLDAVDLIETDSRIQFIFTVLPDVLGHGVDRYLDRLGAFVLPWARAARYPFDVVLAGDVVPVRAPLVVLPDGTVGQSDLARLAVGLPAVVLLAHNLEREALLRQWPDAWTVVTGDLVFDRLIADLPLRAHHRRSLGIANDHELLVVGLAGPFDRYRCLLPTFMEQLPAAGIRIAALLHPSIWATHGTRQVRAWLHDCTDAGMLLPDPADDWRRILVAADHVMGDDGPVTTYGAAIGHPVLRFDGPDSLSAASEVVSRTADRLDMRRPLVPQMRCARRLDGSAIVAALTSHPGDADRRLRRALYNLLRLAEPDRHRRTTPAR